MHEKFRLDILQGLTSDPKYIPSKYFYDETGDELFQQIMTLDEYYLTDAEFEILSENKDDLLQHFNHSCKNFHLIEFGAGDAYKTKTLLKHFAGLKINFEYNPIDISANAIDSLMLDIQKTIPGIEVFPYNLEYDRALDVIDSKDTCRKIVLFLGSNIGNFNQEETIVFFMGINKKLKPGDLLLTGFDLKKDPGVILAAYNDAKGVTGKFNLNVLARINREFGANFDLNAFYHYPVYDPVEGAAKSYLVSLKEQVVEIKALEMEVSFYPFESIFTEISQKYDMEMIRHYARESGFHISKNYFDQRNYFVNSLWENRES